MSYHQPQKKPNQSKNKDIFQEVIKNHTSTQKEEYYPEEQKEVYYEDTHHGYRNQQYYNQDSYYNYNDKSRYNKHNNWNNNYSYHESGYNNNYNRNKYNEEEYSNTYYEEKPKSKKPAKPKNNNITKEVEKILSEFPEISEITRQTIYDSCSEKIECLICNDPVKANNEIWHCRTCSKLIHLKCISDWIDKCNMNTDYGYNWSCPGCKTNYVAKTKPVYDCYCGKYNEKSKERNFNFKKIVIPHTCGLKCDFQICKHLKCNFPCHPGNHLVCKIIEKLYCYCGKSSQDIACITPNKTVPCNKICGKELKCGKHNCKSKCHIDDCMSLFKNNQCGFCVQEEKDKFKVFLSHLERILYEQSKIKVNIADVLSDYIFEGLLPCKKHYEPQNTELNLKFILKLVEVSGDKLSENIRKFIPICTKEYENACSCKYKASITSCYRLNYNQDLLNFLLRPKEKEEQVPNCTKVCNTLKSCKNHTCVRVCCELKGKKIRNYAVSDPNAYHMCMISCNKILKCGIHECTDFCHTGSCKVCTTLIRDKILVCDCGKTKLNPPYPCGALPKCDKPCNKERKCEHPCKMRCHQGECPPCDELTLKQCLCGKEVKKGIVCGEEKLPSCNKQCYEILECNVHFCQEICHIHDSSDDLSNTENYCSSICKREFKQCTHNCQMKCHGETDCNEFSCLTKIKVSCPCKINARTISCFELKKVNKDESQLISCSDECKKVERLKKIEGAFQELLKISKEKFPYYYENQIQDEVTTENGITISHSETKFENGMIYFSKKNLKLIIKAEILIEKFLKNQTSLKDYEIPNLDKKSFVVITEFIKNYYKVEIEGKTANEFKSIILKDGSNSVIPRIRLSLLGLLFRTHSFIIDPKIYHPFEASIHLFNYRYQTKIQEVESFLLTHCNMNDFYVDGIDIGRAYAHFFNKDVGEKVYKKIKSETSQFQDCEIKIYEKNKEEHLKNVYQYITNNEYFEYCNEVRNEEISFNVKPVKEKVVNVDEDGFILVTAKNKNQKKNVEMDEDGFTKLKKKKKIVKFNYFYFSKI